MVDNPKNVTEGPGENLSAVSHKPGTFRTISSEDLFAGHREIQITHEEKTYRLRITNQSKLVLNL